MTGTHSPKFGPVYFWHVYF